MSIEIIQQRLLSYRSNTLLEQDNALKEIAQEIALLGLSRAGFFKVAAFQDGTCLRILYGLDRFSEDLDFVLIEPNPSFNWDDYTDHLSDEFSVYGYTLEVRNKQRLGKAVQTAFLKADSQGGLLILKETRTQRPKLQIKLEIDTHPPAGSDYDLKYLDFPLVFSIQTQDLPGLFAGKCHVLLCREYVKGRDWYDFIWYVARKTKVNFDLLSAALAQAGPWAGENIRVKPDWFLKALKEKIHTIDWLSARQDVEKFLKPREITTLDLWSRAFFESRVDVMRDYLLVK